MFINPLTPTVAIWLWLSVRVPGCQILQMTAQPGLAPDALYFIAVPVTMATVGVKGLTRKRML